MGVRQGDHLAERDPRLPGDMGQGTLPPPIGLQRFVDPPLTEPPDKHLLPLLGIGWQLFGQLSGTGMEILGLAMRNSCSIVLPRPLLATSARD
jgi:hypothetical protein